ncbi:ice-binding family protein [Paludisphaera mucosa]|uniref:Ice-binding family protein n=1 Tax=Paludisphaera mucosa TaxID=3030827 RepID=A0ABT6F3R6_9BACT|nr:ice-binding family protein [Paludisphaera mucosa]
MTGFPPGVVTPPFTIHAGDAVAAQAQVDLTTAYNAAAALAPTQDLSGMNLGGMVLLPGVYFFSSSAQLTGTLTLDAQGDADAQFVFQIGSTLTTASDSSVSVINTGGELPGCNVFWQVGSSATLGTGTDFAGHILALTSITLNTDASIINGSALARNGAVTLDSNTIVNCVDVAAVPEPAASTLALICGPILGVVALARGRRLGRAAS